MAPSGRDEGRGLSLLKLLIGSLDFRARGHVITIDSCYNEAHDGLTFYVIGAPVAVVTIDLLQ